MGPPHKPLAINRQRGEVRVPAIASPSRFSRLFVQPGHHAVVWKGGRARFGALFATDASDHDVRAALSSLGARAGENLSEDTWNQRRNTRSGEPDKRVDGAPVEVLVEWAGSGGAVPLAQLIDEAGRPASFDFRFGGNERYQKTFKSGCVVCTSSCPGGAIGNRNRTIREEVTRGTAFTVNKRVPKNGTEVTVIFRVRATR